MNNLLINKELKFAGDCSVKIQFEKRYKSVTKFVYTDTTSSAGDWSGYFVQKIGKNFYMIGFSQSNNFPNSGFTLYTMENYFAKFQSIDYLDELEKEFCEFYYEM